MRVDLDVSGSCSCPCGLWCSRLGLQLIGVVGIEEDLDVAVFYRCRRDLGESLDLERPVVVDFLNEKVSDFFESNILFRVFEGEGNLFRTVVRLRKLAHIVEVRVVDQVIHVGPVKGIELEHVHEESQSVVRPLWVLLPKVLREAAFETA